MCDPCLLDIKLLSPLTQSRILMLKAVAVLFRSYGHVATSTSHARVSLLVAESLSQQVVNGLGSATQLAPGLEMGDHAVE
jgi:hypothetical protein